MVLEEGYFIAECAKPEINNNFEVPEVSSSFFLCLLDIKPNDEAEFKFGVSN